MKLGECRCNHVMEARGSFLYVSTQKGYDAGGWQWVTHHTAGPMKPRRMDKIHNKKVVMHGRHENCSQPRNARARFGLTTPRCLTRMKPPPPTPPLDRQLSPFFFSLVTRTFLDPRATKTARSVTLSIV